MIPPQVRLAEDSGDHPTEAALLISYLSIGSSIGRLIFGRIADCKTFNRFYVWQTGLLGVSVSSTLVTMVSAYKWLVVYAIMFGLFEGCYVSVNPVLIRDIVGSEKFAHGLGLAFFTMSLTESIGPPIAGWIYDKFYSYYAAFMYTGLVFLLANCIAFVVPVLMQEKSNITKLGGKSKSLPFVYVDRETDV